MYHTGKVIFLILVLMVGQARGAAFRIFEEPLHSSWASFAFDADGDRLACNYGGQLFLWSPEGEFIDIGAGYSQSGSIGISADGRTVCATRLEPADGYANPAIWTKKDGWVNLGHTLDGLVENGSWGSCFDLSDDGTEAVGLAWTSQGSQAFQWDAENGMNRLLSVESETTSRATAIAGNGSVVVGFTEHPIHGSRLPVLWDTSNASILKQYAGPEVQGEGLAVNYDGNMVVGYHVSNQIEQAHLWTPENGMIFLGNLSGSSWDPSRATHVTENGQVLGTSHRTTWDLTEAFIWDVFDGMIRLQDHLQEQGAIIPDNLWITEVLAVSGDGSMMMGSWQNAHNEQGYWMGSADQRQKGRIRECLASLDGSRMELNFDLALDDSTQHPVLVANRNGQQWEVPLHFNDLNCGGTDYQANLGQQGEVVYELTLRNGSHSEILNRFSVWMDKPATENNTLLGSLVPKKSNSHILNFRIQKNDHLVISSKEQSGSLISQLNDRVFETGYHRVFWDAQASGSTGPNPGQYIHIQWQ